MSPLAAGQAKRPHHDDDDDDADDDELELDEDVEASPAAGFGVACGLSGRTFDDDAAAAGR